MTPEKNFFIPFKLFPPLLRSFPFTHSKPSFLTNVLVFIEEKEQYLKSIYGSGFL